MKNFERGPSPPALSKPARLPRVFSLLLLIPLACSLCTARANDGEWRLSISAGLSSETAELSWSDQAGNQNRLVTSETLPFIHPTARYYLADGGQQSVTAEITSPTQFWKVERTPAVPGIHLAAEGEHTGKLVFYNEEGDLVPLRAFGINYYDAFMRCLDNGNDLSFIEGFSYLQEHGIPVVRVIAGGFWPKQWELYFQDRDEFYRRLDRFVEEAEKHKIGLIFTLFWYGKSTGEVVRLAVEGEVLVPGEDFVPNNPLYNDKNGNPTYAEYTTDFGREDSGTNAWIRHYTRELVGRYVTSPAVWGWEFGNELNLMVDHSNVPSHRNRPGTLEVQGMVLPATTADLNVLPLWTGPDDLKRSHVEVAKRIFAETVRSIDTWRFIKSGDSRPRPQAFHNWTAHTWTADNRAQNQLVMPVDNPRPMDTVTVHLYPGTPGGLPTTYFPNDNPLVIQWLTGQYRELLEYYRASAAAIGQGLILGEFGAPGDGTTADERETFHRFMQGILDAGVQLSLLWTFDTRNRGLSEWFLHTGSDPNWPATPKLYQITNDDPALWDLSSANAIHGRFPGKTQPPEGDFSGPGEPWR